MSTKTLDIHELGALIHRSQSTILKGRVTTNGRKPHPLYAKGFKAGDGRNSKLLWFEDDVIAYLEQKRESVNQ